MTRMPLAYTIDPDEKLITISGEYANAEEWKRLLGEILRDSRRQPGFAFLRDLRTAKHPVDAVAVVGIIDVVRRFWPELQPCRAAVVTPLEFDPAAGECACRRPTHTFTGLHLIRGGARVVTERRPERGVMGSGIPFPSGAESACTQTNGVVHRSGKRSDRCFQWAGAAMRPAKSLAPPSTRVAFAGTACAGRTRDERRAS